MTTIFGIREVQKVHILFKVMVNLSRGDVVVLAGGLYITGDHEPLLDGDNAAWIHESPAFDLVWAKFNDSFEVESCGRRCQLPLGCLSRLPQHPGITGIDP